MKKKIGGIFGGRPYVLLVLSILFFTVINLMRKTGTTAGLALRIAGGLPFVILLLEVQENKAFACFGYGVLFTVFAAELGILFFL